MKLPHHRPPRLCGVSRAADKKFGTLKFGANGINCSGLGEGRVGIDENILLRRFLIEAVVEVTLA